MCIRDSPYGALGRGGVQQRGHQHSGCLLYTSAPAPASDKKKALQTALAQIDKNFGKGTVMRLGDRPEMNVEAIPTGSLALDAALGIGGVPKGRIIEIYGPESSGKTTLALHILAEAQKRGGEVAFVDAEHALDPVSYTHLNPGRALSREDILSAVWGRDYEGELKIVDVNIRRLRLKIEDDTSNPTYITTVWGLGYKWGA